MAPKFINPEIDQEKMRKLTGEAQSQVRENEDASLQDQSYSFDESNTDDEDFHDIDDPFANEDIDFDFDEDYIP